MDQTSFISHTPIPEIWQFPLVGVPPGGVAVPRINARDNNSSVAESTVTDQSAGSRGRRRRRDSAPPSEDESSKLISTSSGNDGVILSIHLVSCFWFRSEGFLNWNFGEIVSLELILLLDSRRIGWDLSCWLELVQGSVMSFEILQLNAWVVIF